MDHIKFYSLVLLFGVTTIIGCDSGREPARKSQERLPLFEAIDRAMQIEQQRTRSFYPDLSGKSPGFLQHNFHFQEVDNIDNLLFEFANWKQEQNLPKKVREVEERLRNVTQRGPTLGVTYDFPEYAARFQYLLDTIRLLADLNRLEEARGIADRLFAFTNIEVGEGAHGTNKELQEVELVKMSLHAEALWIVADSFEDIELFEKSIAYLGRGLVLADALEDDDRKLELKRILLEEIASRRLRLARSGYDVERNLTVAKNLLEPEMNAGHLSTNGLITYIAVNYEVDDYKSAYQAVSLLANQAEKESAVNLTGVTFVELTCITFLAKLGSAAEFKKQFGPFAGSIYSECTNRSLSDAWNEVYGEDLNLTNDCGLAKSAVIIGDLVLYEGARDASDQIIMALHEYMHSAVKFGSVYKSEGHWLPAFRDVPNAALWTYMQEIKESSDSGKTLPPCLSQYVELGRQWSTNEGENIEKYVENMLGYFAIHRQETNAAYSCAAIYAGILLEIIGDPGSPQMESYIDHLLVADHRTALDKSRRNIPLEIDASISLFTEKDIEKIENPVSAKDFFNRGILKSRQQKTEEAIEDLRAAITLNPEYIDAYIALGIAYASQGKHNEAIQEFSRVIEIDPVHPEPYLYRGEIHAELGKLEDAISDFTLLSEVAPNNAVPYIHRGMVYEKKALLAEALQDYNAAILIDPDSPMYYVIRGNLLFRTGKTEPAIMNYREALKRNPQLSSAHDNLAYALFEKGDYDKAVNHWDQVLALTPEDPDALAGKALAMEKKGQHSEAERLYKRALQIDGRFGDCDALKREFMWSAKACNTAEPLMQGVRR